MHPKEVGDRTTLAVALMLRALGYIVSEPRGENARYDLVIDDGTTLQRVQCETGRLRNGAVLFATSSCYGHHRDPLNARKDYDGQVDAFAVYCIETAGSISSRRPWCQIASLARYQSNRPGTTSAIECGSRQITRSAGSTSYLGHDPLVARVAVIGLGAMGSRMARRLLDAGHDLAVWNRTPERARELGMMSAASPTDAARGADFAITMVSDPPALAEVTEGEDGVLAAAPGALIQMSTVGVEATDRLREAATVPLLDAPVLGSRAEAEAGELVIFAAGDDDVFERARPVLEVLGTPLRVSDGQRAKLVANGVLFGVLAVLGEALRLARDLGLDDETAWDVLAKTPLAPQVERRREQLADGEFPPRFALSLARKDAQLIEQTGAEGDVAAAARRYLEHAEAAGYGERDYAALLEWLRQDFA